MAIDYGKKHRLYEAARARRELALDLYEGGSRVEGKEKYLTRHPFETDKQYQIRLERSTYRNFAAPVVDVFASFICDGRPERKLPKSLAPMLPNVDRLQTNADVFFTNMARLAAAGGARFALVDMEMSLGQTVAESVATGRRELPYFVAVSPDDVWDWQIDERGLSWVVIHSVESLPTGAFATAQERDALTIWTRRDWTRLVGQAHDAGWINSHDLTMTAVASGEHPCGEVPVVPFLFEPIDAMCGNPATDDVLSLILRVYRRDSELDKMLFDCAVPLGVFNGVDEEMYENFVRSSSNILMSNSIPGISGSYVEPLGTSYQSLRESLAEDIASIREISLRMVRPQSAVGESAESKNLDKQQLDTQLAAYARRCAAAEEKCWELAYKWLNNGAIPVAGEISAPYNENYKVQDEERLDRAYLLEMKRSGAISGRTYLELLQKIGVLPADWNTENEAERLEGEMKAGGSLDADFEKIVGGN